MKLPCTDVSRLDIFSYVNPMNSNFTSVRWGSFFPVAVRTCLLICRIDYRTKRWSDIKLHPSFALRIPISMSAPVLTDRNIGSLIKRFVSYASHEKKKLFSTLLLAAAPPTSVAHRLRRTSAATQEACLPMTASGTYWLLAPHTHSLRALSHPVLPN